MQKDPADRQGSAAELQQELQQEAGATQVMPAAAAAAAVPRRSGSVWPWIVAAVVLLLLLLGAGGYWYYTQQANKVAVPNLTGRRPRRPPRRSTAARAPGRHGQQHAVGPGGDVPAGSVIQQDPAAGVKAPKGSKVNITLNGPSQVQVPNVVGQTEAQAIEALADGGLHGRAVEAVVRRARCRWATSSPRTPAAGAQAPKGATVTLTISKGQQQGAVPDVIGADAGGRDERDRGRRLQGRREDGEQHVRRRRQRDQPVARRAA